MGFARLWSARAPREGHGELRVVNLFAYRATHPMDLLATADPIGPENERYLVENIGWASMIVMAWGSYDKRLQRLRKPPYAPYTPHVHVQYLIDREGKGERLYHLGTTKDGQPRHPLYIPYSREPISFLRKT